MDQVKRRDLKDVYHRSGQIPLECYLIIGNGSPLEFVAGKGKEVETDADGLASVLRVEGFGVEVGPLCLYAVPFGGIKASIRVDVLTGRNDDSFCSTKDIPDDVRKTLKIARR